MKRILQALAVFGGAAALLAISLVWPRPMVTSAIFSCVLTVILASAIAAIVAHGERAIFWRGFALCGGVYLLIAIACEGMTDGIARYNQMTMIEEPPRRYLASSYLLAWVYDVSLGEEIWTSGGTRVPAMHLLGLTRNVIPQDLDFVAFQQFLIAGHSVLALIVGWLGGTATAWIAARRK